MASPSRTTRWTCCGKQEETTDVLPLVPKVATVREAPHGFIEVPLAGLMGWDEVLIQADLARSMNDSVHTYL